MGAREGRDFGRNTDTCTQGSRKCSSTLGGCKQAAVFADILDKQDFGTMIAGVSPVVQALLGTLFTWGLTAAGAALVFVFSSRQKRILDGSLGFAAGVMLAASYWSLLAPAIEMAEESGKYGDFAFFPVAVGFTLGALFVYIADLMMPVLTVLVEYSDIVISVKYMCALSGQTPSSCLDSWCSHFYWHCWQTVRLKEREMPAQQPPAKSLPWLRSRDADHTPFLLQRFPHPLLFSSSSSSGYVTEHLSAAAGTTGQAAAGLSVWRTQAFLHTDSSRCFVTLISCPFTVDEVTV
ncbi:hypothetical protein QQF64_004204 [Cirrhinus molitorella]|uniref:Zinc transporter ZIP11 n=1 Tax=Cirrhinus molitorella TaxID=172907 RepID=A0ABR3MIK8_9TELE